MSTKQFGLVAGSGRFPALIIQHAREVGVPVVVVGIEGQASPELETHGAKVHWVPITQLQRVIDTFKTENVTDVMLAGKIDHRVVLSNGLPDLRLGKMLFNLQSQGPTVLLEAICSELRHDGLRLAPSTTFVESLLAQVGQISRRKPDKKEKANVEYGLPRAKALAQWDVGQTVVICEKACLAAEAMEGTDAMILRAGDLSLGRPMTIVKASASREHLLYDVPSIGPSTLDLMAKVNATCLAVEGGTTLILDRSAFVSRADELDIAVVALPSGELA